MYFDVIEARYLGDYKIGLVFEDGKQGAADLREYLDLGGVFSRFADMEYFRNFHLDKESGTLCWPDGLDIAPETLYHEATGEPLPSWMTQAAVQRTV